MANVNSLSNTMLDWQFFWSTKVNGTLFFVQLVFKYFSITSHDWPFGFLWSTKVNSELFFWSTKVNSALFFDQLVAKCILFTHPSGPHGFFIFNNLASPIFLASHIMYA